MTSKLFSGPIQDDIELLNLMVDSEKNAEILYKAGPYWSSKSARAIREIKRAGISNFRSDQNACATSYGDNPLIDSRNISNFGVRSLLIKFFRIVYPFNKFFNEQANLTKNYFRESIFYQSEFLKNLDRVNVLLEKYKVPTNSTKGDCLVKGDFDGKIVSFHYLQMLDTLDYVHRDIDFSKKKSLMEIGGGFGANIHLIVENFPNIRKIIYLDIPPNLYVGTQYLKSFYGSNVIDFRETIGNKKITFSENDELEIFCIMPYQIENVVSSVDVFYNAHSFVEMSFDVVRNYAFIIEGILNEKSKIALVTYDNPDNSTLNPDLLPKFFNRELRQIMVPTLFPSKNNFHFISN
jgi:putative sugar O-methyltransferase